MAEMHRLEQAIELELEETRRTEMLDTLALLTTELRWLREHRRYPSRQGEITSWPPSPSNPYQA